MPVNSHQIEFFWCNNQETRNAREQIDRVVYNWPWRRNFPNATLKILPIITSDNSPIALTLFPKPSGSCKMFRF